MLFPLPPLRPASMESAVRAGSFLYVQQSLLSDLNSREGAYIQVRGAGGAKCLLSDLNSR